MSLVTTDFNPRPPRGGRPYAVNGYQKALDISIHAPREGGDCIAPNQNYYDQSISIHAPREGGDQKGGVLWMVKSNFNPRPPRGGRLRVTEDGWWRSEFQSTPPARGATGAAGDCLQLGLFQSTPPARGATCWCHARPTGHAISIHAPREGGDAASRRRLVGLSYFNPRPPRGGRLEPVQIGVVRLEFQSTPPARGATSCSGI